MSNHAEDIDAYLKQMCQNCKKANRRCIKDEAYIGLCAVVDREEIIEHMKARNKHD